MAKKVKKSDFIASGQVAVNRRATFDYAIEETFTAGWNCAVPKSSRCGWGGRA